MRVCFLWMGLWAGLAAGNLWAADAAPARPAAADVAKDKVLYVVGYSHLDTQWRWDYAETIRQYIPDTMRDNFKLIEKYPNYLFNFTGSRRYEFMQEYFPDDFKKVKEYVAAGRWYPAGSSVDEGDSIVPSGESIIRQVLYGNHYFRREFGVASDEFMLPDCFGFPASLPSLLAHCGLKGFSTQKLTWGSAVGVPFPVGRWIGPDGGQVVVALDPGAYVSKVREDLSESSSWLKRIENTGKQSGAFVDYHYYGIGDRGGAPDEESVQWVMKSLQGKGPVKVLSARADDLFRDLPPKAVEKLPSYEGEFLLTNHSAGSITSQSYVKRWNRKAELLADAAERVSVAALWLGGTPYPAKKLYDGWNLILGTQMHDILPGTSIPKAYEYSWNDHVLALNQFAAVHENAAARVASVLDTRTQGIPVVVYNSLSTEREDVVEAAVVFPSDAPAHVQVFGPDGREVLSQVNRREGNIAHLLFIARVPSVGFSVYDVRPGKGAVSLPGAKVAERTLENDRYQVRINAQGDVESIMDRKAGQELLAGPVRLEFQYENPRQFPAWNMDWEDRQKPPYAPVEGPAVIRIVESGPVRVAMEVDRSAQGSRFVQRVRLAAGDAGDRVEFDNLIDWNTRESSLKAAFPFAASNPQAVYEEKVGVLERGNNDPKKFEVPQQQWFGLTDKRGGYGAAVLNDSKYGSDKPSDNLLRLTLLYTPGTQGGYWDQATQDIGRHQILYAVAGYAGDWKKGNVVGKARRLNQPLVAFQTEPHDGALGKAFSLFKLDKEQVEIIALKKAEDSDAIIVRLQEWGGEAAPVRLSAAVPITEAREVNGQEQPLEAAVLENGTLAVRMNPFGLKTFALRLGPAAAKAGGSQGRPVSLPHNADVISANNDRSDGAFTEDGTYPAEQIPGRLVSEGVEFVMGSGEPRQKNAVICRGQSIPLPEGDFNRIYFLAAAAQPDAAGKFQVGERAVEISVGNWNGFIGQWDNRWMDGDTMAGLAPGYIRRDNVAWFATHWHSRKADEYYQFCYLFKYALDLPAGVRSVTLPKNEAIRIFAMTAVQDAAPLVRAVQPLYDTLEERKTNSVPGIQWDPAKTGDALRVSLTPPLYWKRGLLRYTVDGSEPSADSPLYTEPFWVHAAITVKARQFGEYPSPTAEAAISVQDAAPPKATLVSMIPESNSVLVRFSEPLRKKEAEDPQRYVLQPAVPVRSAKLNADGTQVLLILGSAPAPGVAHRLVLRDIRDNSPAGNAADTAPLDIAEDRPVYRLASFLADGTNFLEEEKEGLPVNGEDSWTMNLFVKMDQQPANRTLIAGFGELTARGRRGRFLAKFAPGIHYWTANQDLYSRTPYDLGKWQMVTAVYDGAWLFLYRNGEEIGRGKLALSKDKSIVHVAPLDPWEKERRFKGEIRDLTIWKTALQPDQVKLLFRETP
jgi:alpha-mannosidase